LLSVSAISGSSGFLDPFLRRKSQNLAKSSGDFADVLALAVIALSLINLLQALSRAELNSNRFSQ